MVLTPLYTLSISFLGTKITHLEEAAVFDLIVRTVGVEHIIHSCDEEIFSGCGLQIIVRKKH